MHKYVPEGGSANNIGNGGSKSNKTSGIQLPMIKNSLIGIMSDNKLVTGTGGAGGLKSLNHSRIKLDNSLIGIGSPDK